MFTPGDAPVLVQSQFAGNQTTSVGDRGAAALYEVLTMPAILFAVLGAIHQNGVFAFKVEAAKDRHSVECKMDLTVSQQSSRLIDWATPDVSVN